MPYRDDSYMIMMSNIKWQDVEDVITEYGLTEVFGDFNPALVDDDEIEYCYQLLQERFTYSTFRYTDVHAVLLALRRTSRYAMPALIEKQRLYEMNYQASIEDLRKQRQQVRNSVEKPNISGNSQTDKVPFSTLSNSQETVTQIDGMIDSLIEKWKVVRRNMYDEFYAEYMPLFVSIIADSDDEIIYQQ